MKVWKSGKICAIPPKIAIYLIAYAILHDLLAFGRTKYESNSNARQANKEVETCSVENLNTTLMKKAA